MRGGKVVELNKTTNWCHNDTRYISYIASIVASSEATVVQSSIDSVTDSSENYLHQEVETGLILLQLFRHNNALHSAEMRFNKRITRTHINRDQ